MRAYLVSRLVLAEKEKVVAPLVVDLREVVSRAANRRGREILSKKDLLEVYEKAVVKTAQAVDALLKPAVAMLIYLARVMRHTANLLLRSTSFVGNFAFFPGTVGGPL